MDDDKAFIRQHAAEIAQALREQDEGLTRTGESQEDSTLMLYRTLCFDEPLIETVPNFSTAASALSRQLVLVSSPLALSNRLVNGIVYLCRQRNNASTDSTASGNVDDSTTALALAKLAFAVLIQVPLECCQELHAKNISRLRAHLGSYKGVLSAIHPDDSTDAQAGLVDERINQLTEALAGMGTNSAMIPPSTELEPTKDDSSLQEVWATESDPSDYDFGEGDTTEFPQLPLTTELADMLDPMILSQADPQLTIEDAKAAIGSLLQLANYSVFAPLFLQAKKQVEVHISQLTQLVLLLLQPPQLILTLTEDVAFSSTFQDAMLAPLWILRDAALHHPSQEHSFYTSSYMEVLQALLAVDQAYQSDVKQNQHTTLLPSTSSSQSPLCSASIVGLSALSSWCCSAQISHPPTITAITDSMNDLAHVMERATTSGYRDNLKHSITPIIEVLTGITYEGNSKTSPMGGTTMIPQTLLNSGFLRQLLMLSLEKEEAAAAVSDSKSSPLSATTPPYQLDHGLWGLCIVYPTVVGKYVARYPGFSTIVRRYHPNPTSSTRQSRDCVQSILWNCFAMANINQNGSDAPRIIWKNKAENGKLSVPSLINKEECQEVGQKSWETLFAMIASSIHDAPLVPQQALETIQDWERLLKFLRIPTVGASFQSMISDPQEQLNLIRSPLAQGTGTPTDVEASINLPSTKEKLDDEEDESAGRKKPSLTTEQVVLATVRKVLKQYTLFFQGNGRCSSKTD